MFSELARVFSSQGVVVPGAERIPVYGGRNTGTEAPSGEAFPALFDQASSRLDLSQRSREAAAAQAAGNAGDTETGNSALSDRERKVVDKLEKRDREVRAHEQAHIANAGGYAKGGPRYEYQAGPDGKSYAVGGSVQIDTSPVPGNPQATLQKAAVLRRAAMAPADPSGADRGVAAAAAHLAVQARKDLAEKASESGESGAGAGREATVAEGRKQMYGKGRPGTGANLNILA